MNTYKVVLISSMGPVVMAEGLRYDDAVTDAKNYIESATVQIVPELPGDAGTPITEEDW